MNNYFDYSKSYYFINNYFHFILLLLNKIIFQRNCFFINPNLLIFHYFLQIDYQINLQINLIQFVYLKAIIQIAQIIKKIHLILTFLPFLNFNNLKQNLIQKDFPLINLNFLSYFLLPLMLFIFTLLLNLDQSFLKILKVPSNINDLNKKKAKHQLLDFIFA